MVTGYEVQFYRDIERIRAALEMLVDIQRANYLAARVQELRHAESREHARTLFTQLDNKIVGGGR